MEYLPKGLTLELTPGAFPLSTDSMVLSHFARLPKNARVLDLGSGCGTLGLLLCARDPRCTVTGVELDERAHFAALSNIENNSLQSRMNSICTDLRSFSHGLSTELYTLCVSNPPYFTGGPASGTSPLARRDDCCSSDDLFATASRCIQFGSDFYLVHKPDKLAQLCACAVKNSLEPKRLRLIRHHSGAEVSMILLQCRKGAKPGLVWEEMCLFDHSGVPTEHYKRIYHL